MNQDPLQSPPGHMRQPSPEQMAMQKKVATAQLANQIFLSLCVADHNKKEVPKALVDRSFALAEAFDQRMNELLKPPSKLAGV